MHQYRPFVLRVGERESDHYQVTGEFEGASWSSSLPATIPLLSSAEQAQALAWLERGFVDRDYAQDLGRRLFATLMPPAVLDGFRAAYGRAAEHGDGVRLALMLPDELSGLPWELIFDSSDRHGFLARSATAPLVRYFPGMPLPHEASEGGPLRILVVIAAPEGLPPLSGEQEASALARRLQAGATGITESACIAIRHLTRSRTLRGLAARLRSRRLVEVEVLAHASRVTLQNRLIEARNAGRGYHVIHLVAHGSADNAGGQVFLETAAGAADPVPAAEFAEMIAEPGVSLVVLNACQTAAALSFFNGVAQATLRRGVPAVVGMQVPILDRTALEFAREFYGAWAGGEPIEAALAYARRLITRETPGAAADWGIPVLYMAPVDGLSLKMQPPALPKAPRIILTAAWALAVTIVPTTFFYLDRMPKGPPAMSRLFNVAVADFGQVADPTHGPVTSSEDGAYLAKLVAEKLEARLNDIHALAGDVEILHDRVGLVRGDTPQARQLAAAELARKTNADVVIYGNIVSGPQPADFVPEFYISPRLTGAEESTGPDTFGAPLQVTLPIVQNPDNRARLMEQAIPRFEALTEFMFGLAFFKGEQPNYALEQLELAAGVKAWSSEPGQGKEILYLWIGSTLIQHALTGDAPLPCPLAAAAGDWGCARGAYEEALQLNPRFARAHIGLGRYWADQALQQRGGRTIISCGAYDRAIEAYHRALAPDMEAAETAYVELKAYFNIGLTYANAFRDGCDREADAPAVEHLLEAVAIYRQDAGRSQTPLVRELGARAFYQLGRVYAGSARYDAAVQAFSEVMAVADPAKAPEEGWQAIRWNAAIQRGFAYNEQALAGSVTAWHDALNSFNLVIARYEAGKLSDAVVAADAYFGAGTAYEGLGQQEQAGSSYERVFAVVGLDTSIGRSAQQKLVVLGQP